MKEKTMFICEHCGGMYTTPGEANKCEKEHATPVEISEKIYHRFEKYPHVIKIKMSNGKSVIYSSPIEV